jgi:hypothetical protein
VFVILGGSNIYSSRASDKSDVSPSPRTLLVAGHRNIACGASAPHRHARKSGLFQLWQPARNSLDFVPSLNLWNDYSERPRAGKIEVDALTLGLRFVNADRLTLAALSGDDPQAPCEAGLFFELIGS